MNNILKVVLPIPVSANVYWRTAIIRGKSITYVSKEAKVFKSEVRMRVLETGFREKFTENVKVEIKLFPNRPKDWIRRARIDEQGWANTVRRIDLDNALKTLLDSFKDFVFEDDKNVVFIKAEVCRPDEFGGRVEVEVSKAD